MPRPPTTKEEFLELWRRVLPREYTAPVEAEQNGQGFDVPSAQAEIFAQAEDAHNRIMQAAFLKPHTFQTAPPAAGASKATAEVEIRRAPPANGELVLLAGTRLLAVQQGSLGQRIEIGEFRLVDDATLPEGSLGPFTVEVEAYRPGYWGNVGAGRITEFVELGRAEVPAEVLALDALLKPTPAPADPLTDNFTEAMVGQYVRILGLTDGPTAPRRITTFIAPNAVRIDPPLTNVADIGLPVTVEVEEFGDLGLTLEQPEAASGGVQAFLDQIGRDRRQGRVSGEADDPYRNRLCELPDTVSPAAIRRICERILGPLGVPCELKETLDVQTLMGFTWDVHPYDFGGLSAVTKPPGSQLAGQGHVFAPACCFFMLCVGFGNQGEFGLSFDDAQAPGLNAWDQGFYDGSPVVYNSAVGQLHEAIDQARAGGVGFLIVRDPTL